MASGQVQFSKYWKSFDFDKMIGHVTDYDTRIALLDACIEAVDAIDTTHEKGYYGDLRSDLRRTKAETVLTKIIVDRVGAPPPSPKKKRAAKKKPCVCDDDPRLESRDDDEESPGT